jgi:hypothetical protein
MYSKQDIKEKLAAAGMIPEAEATDILYGGRGSHKQSLIQKQLARVVIPSDGETERAYTILYFRSDVEELKVKYAETVEAVSSSVAKHTREVTLSQGQIDAIAEAVLSRLGGK